MIERYFDKIFCLNLDRRTDRWEQAQQQFKNMDIHGVERISAIDAEDITSWPPHLTRNKYACFLSHLKIFEYAKTLGIQSHLLFEDDIEFHPQFNEQAEKLMQQLPSNWDCFWFSGNHRAQLFQVTENIYRTTATWALHAVAFKSSSYNIIINGLKINQTNAVDVVLGDLSPYLNMYVARPHYCWQSENYSDIENKIVFYDHLKDIL